MLDADHSKHLQLQNLFDSTKLMKKKNPQNRSCFQTSGVSCLFLVLGFFPIKPEFLTSGRHVGLRKTVILHVWFCENKN